MKIWICNECDKDRPCLLLDTGPYFPITSNPYRCPHDEEAKSDWREFKPAEKERTSDAPQD